MWFRCQEDGTFLNADDFATFRVDKVVLKDGRHAWSVFADARCSHETISVCTYENEQAARNHLERLGRRLAGEEERGGAGGKAC